MTRGMAVALTMQGCSAGHVPPNECIFTRHIAEEVGYYEAVNWCSLGVDPHSAGSSGAGRRHVPRLQPLAGDGASEPYPDERGPARRHHRRADKPIQRLDCASDTNQHRQRVGCWAYYPVEYRDRDRYPVEYRERA